MNQRRTIARAVAALIAIPILIGTGPVRAESRARLPLVPWPREVRDHEGRFPFVDGALLIVSAEAGEDYVAAARLFADKVRARHGVSLEVVLTTPNAARECAPGSVRAAVEGGCASCERAIVASPEVYLCDPDPERSLVRYDHKEGYKLKVGGNILVEAQTGHGLHNGLMTLLQLIDSSSSPPSAPGVLIVDEPRFKWRGMLLDSSRTFLPTDVIKAYIDRLSELKLNILHWHIVDDQGWRIESKVFPKLHEVGGIVSNMSDKKLRALARIKLDDQGRRVAGGRYASPEEAAVSRGYYTQDELREIVAYAAQRHVMIVPEIDIPGHSTEMIAAYPELQCSGAPVEVAKVGQLARNALCPGKEEVYEFLDQLFGEIAGIFPAPYVHIGSDEVWTTEWMDAPENQWLIEKYGFTDNNGLQGYFVERVNAILQQHGKTMIAWDEIAEYAPAGTIVQAWRKHDWARVAAERGNDAIVSPVTHCYIDYPQLQFTLKNLYQFEPVPAGLAPDLTGRILGGEVNMWGERVTLDNLDRKAFPRVLAHAEVLWSPAEARDWGDFTSRLRVVRADMKERGVGFGKTWRDLLLAWPEF